MKQLIYVLLSSTLFFSTAALAHGDHGKVNQEQLIRIAAKVTQQLTFKDLGFSVGKLDKSWKQVSADKFKVAGMAEKNFIVSSKNTATNQPLYFLISPSGKVLKVSKSNEF